MLVVILIGCMVKLCLPMFAVVVLVNGVIVAIMIFLQAIRASRQAR